MTETRGVSINAEYIQQIREFLQRAEFAWIAETSEAAVHTYGRAYGRIGGSDYQWRGYDRKGRSMLGTVKYDDSQALDDTQPEPVAGLPVERVRREAVAPSVAAKDCMGIARDSAAQIEDRVGALREWMARDRDAASTFIADELCRIDLPDDWRDAIVFAAENVHFKTQEQQQRVCSRLRELALELRKSTKAGTEHVVWSAMRRFSSLLHPEDANCLLEFLDRDGAVDTRMVALQGVTRLFEAAPPTDPHSVDVLAERVAEYAEKFLDSDVFSGGDNSAIARNAVVALAALGSLRLERCVEQVNALRRRWFSTQVRRQLHDLLVGWKRGNKVLESDAVVELIERCVTALA